MDYSAQPLPKGYELVFSRDSLQHIPMHGAWQFLNNVRASGAKYLLVGSYVTTTAPNTNIAGGGWGGFLLGGVAVQQCGDWALCGCATSSLLLAIYLFVFYFLYIYVVF